MLGFVDDERRGIGGSILVYDEVTVKGLLKAAARPGSVFEKWDAALLNDDIADV